jgi:hypothetical protein
MTSLNISDNNIGQCVQDPELMKLHGVTYGESQSGKMLFWSKDNKNLGAKCPAYCCSPMGVAALADAIKGMGAMTNLNVSCNQLGVEGAKHIAAGIKVSKCAVAVVLAPFSCPSGHWWNCCCLLLSTG